MTETPQDPGTVQEGVTPGEQSDGSTVTDPDAQAPTADDAGQAVTPQEGDGGTGAPEDGGDALTEQTGGAHAADEPQPGADADGFGGDAPEQADDSTPDEAGSGELPPNVRPGAVSGIDQKPLDGTGTDAADDDEAAESGDAPQD